MRERILPHSIEAEQGVLGSIIIDPEAITQVADFLRTDDFYRDAHRTIYSVIIQLYDRREAADFITLCDHLERHNQLEDVGGATYITSLVNMVPTSGNVEYYGHIVERTAMHRRLIHVAGQITSWAYMEDTDAMSKAEEALYYLSQGRSIRKVVSISEAVSRFLIKLDTVREKRKRGEVAGVPTGFKALDHVLGGLQPSDLIVLAARPAVGKTSLCLNIAHQVMGNSMKAGQHVLMFSLEMGEEQLTRRLISMEAQIDQTQLRNGTFGEDEWGKIEEAAGNISAGRMWIDDTPAISLADMRSRARRVKMEYGLDLIIVDYMQLMQARLTDGKSVENRTQEVALLSRGLKELARELDVPVLALAQLSRAVEQRANKEPQLSDLRESGSIEADSDVVIFIHQDPKMPPIEGKGPILNIMVSKHRNGPVGVVPLLFIPHLTRFYDVEMEAQEAFARELALAKAQEEEEEDYE